MENNNAELSKRDYAVAIDISGSMSKTHKGGKTRFKYAQEQCEAVARKCAEFDSDGIDVYVFNNAVKAYNNVTPERVEQVFNENEPNGGTDTALALKSILDPFFARKATGTWKPLTIIVFTDGEPNSQPDVVKVIVDAAGRIDQDEDLAISFCQVGDDATARRFLQMLDDDLVSKYQAKFDIVDTKNEEEMDKLGSITELLWAAVND